VIPVVLQVVRTVGGQELTLQIHLAGQDIQLLCFGGDKPHIGAVSLASPYYRDGAVRASVSTLTALTHREDLLSRQLADLFCRHFNSTAAASCGIHFDQISPEMIGRIQETVLQMADELVDKLAGHLKKQDPSPSSKADPKSHG
jgi:hypothetical protein